MRRHRRGNQRETLSSRQCWWLASLSLRSASGQSNKLANFQSPRRVGSLGLDIMQAPDGQSRVTRRQRDKAGPARPQSRIVASRGIRLPLARRARISGHWKAALKPCSRPPHGNQWRVAPFTSVVSANVSWRWHRQHQSFYRPISLAGGLGPTIVDMPIGSRGRNIEYWHMQGQHANERICGQRQI